MPGYPTVPQREHTDIILERFVAQLIDGLVFGLTSAVIAASLTPSIAGSSGQSGAGLASIVLIAPVIAFLYNAGLEARWNGQTVGKRLLGIKVVTEAGDEISWKEAIIRNLPSPIAGSWIAYLVALTSMAMDDRRQRLFDRLANTVVVEEHTE